MLFLLTFQFLFAQLDSSAIENFSFQLLGGYTDSVFLDYNNGVVFYIRYYDGIPIDTYRVGPLSWYLDSIRYELIVDEYLKITPESARIQAAQSGLIPTIDVPIRFPKALSFLGEGGKLDIRGSQDILIGGQTTYMHDPSMGADTGSSFPTLNLESSMNVLLTGTVGSKLHITLDYDQKRENQNKNIVRLNYKGEEDEVVQSIEAGQTSFSIEGTQFASFAGGGNKAGLFGLKGVFNFGGLEVQAVLTRETGESSQGTFVGGAREDTLVLYGRDYLKNKFFYIDEPDSITKIYVLVHDGSGVQYGEIYHCMAIYYDPVSQSFDSTLLEDTRFKLLEEQTDFYFYPSTKVLEVKNSISEGNIMGVSYQTAGGRWVGSPLDTTQEVYTIRLIKPQRYMNNIDTLLSRADTLKANLFNLQLKNIYPINFYGMSEYEGLSIDDITLTIYKDSLGSNVWKSAENGKTYLQILNLDNDGDGKIDPTVTLNGRIVQVFDGIRKYLIFPQSYPFMSDSLQDPDSIIYKKPELRYNEGQKYKLVFVRRARLNRIINLSQMDIVEGSEVVKYNGRVLQRNRDYTIDYNIGVITLLDSTILNDPTAKIEINFEYSPLFQSKSRALYGFRAKYGDERFRFGATLLGRSETQDIRRPKIGQEPVKNLILESDFQLNQDVNFLEGILRKITWNTQTSPPNLRLQGEVARSIPNLNTVGYGYIDDMDNSKISRSIYLNYTYWKYGSRPVLHDNSYAPLDLLCDKVNWFTFSNRFRRGDIYDNLSVEEARQYATVLAVRVKPHNNDTASYASISQLIDDRGINIEEMEYLEVVVKGEKGKIHIDLGSYISEDAIWRDRNGNIKGWHNGSLSIIDTEDRNNDGQWIAGEEDTGLDGIYGDDDNWTSTSSDDGNDDFKGYNSSTDDWSHVNGTERNGIFDTEELKVDGVLDTTNDYFEYVIDLSDSNSSYLKTINSNGFRHYLIPLKGASVYRKVGNPYFENIRVARMWISGISTEETYYFAKIEIVGSKWRKMGIFTQDSAIPVDSTEGVGVRTVSVREDPSYTPPPGVELERDPITGEIELERSLGISYSNIKRGHYTKVRYYLDNLQDVLGYSILSFFVKPSPATSPPYPEIRIRIGDTVNFYEYRWKITKSDWQEINIPLDSLTQFKMQIQDSLKNMFSNDTLYSNGTYGFKGSPNLRAIRNYDILVINNTNTLLSGEVWIDELRLKEPRNEIGMAFSFRGRFQAGNLFNVNYNLTQKDEAFKSFSQSLTRFNNSSKNISYQISFRPSLFLPPDWGININTSYSRSISLSLPRYKPNTDIILDEELKVKNRSQSTSERFGFQYSKQRSKNAFLNILLDPITFSATRTKSKTASPTAENENLSNTFTTGYNYSPNVNFKVFGHTITPLPTRISLGATYSNSFAINNDLFSNVIRRDSNKTLGLNYGIDFRPFQSINARFSREIIRDFYWDSVRVERYGHISQLTQNFNVSYGVNVFGIARPNISFNSSFNQRFDKNLQNDTLKDVSNINNSSTLNIQSNLEVRKIARKLLGEDKHKKSDTLLSPTEYILSNLRKIMGYFASPSVSYSIQRQSNYQYVVGDISNEYKFGIEFRPNIVSLMENQLTFNKTRTLNLSENINIPLGNFRLMYNWNESRNYTYTQEQTTEQITWPNITFTLNQLYLKPIVGKGNVIANPSLSISYTSKRQRQGISGEPIRSTSNDVNIVPRLSFRLIKRISVNTNYNYSLQVDTSFVGTPQQTSTKRHGITASTSYSFRNPQGLTIPGIGRLKLNNEVTLNLSYSLNVTQSDRTNLDTLEKTPITHSLSYNLSVSASYNFSRDITGTLTFSKSGNEDRIHERKTVNTSLNIKASFRF